MSVCVCRSVQWVKYYTTGCSAYCHVSYCPLAACVPKSRMVLGINGDAVAADILANAKDVNSMGLGGFMVWEASVLDAKTGARAVVYGTMDASIAKLDAWATALKQMQSNVTVLQ